MIATPATLVVLLLAGLLVVFGIFVLRNDKPDQRTGRICPRAGCGQRNPPPAAFCGRCGERLGTDPVDNTGKR